MDVQHITKATVLTKDRKTYGNVLNMFHKDWKIDEAAVEFHRPKVSQQPYQQQQKKTV